MGRGLKLDGPRGMLFWVLPSDKKATMPLGAGATWGLSEFFACTRRRKTKTVCISGTMVEPKIWSQMENHSNNKQYRAMIH